MHLVKQPSVSIEKNIFLKGIGWNSLGISFRLLRFAYLIVFARLLGIHAFGQYILFFSIVEAASKIATCGLEYGSIKYFQIQYKNQPNFHISTALFKILPLCMLTSIAVMLLVGGLAWVFFHQHLLLEDFLFYSLLIPLLGTLNFLSIVSRATLDMRYENIFRNCIETLGIFVFGYVFLNQAPLIISLFKAHACAACLSITCFLWALAKNYRPSPLKISWRMLFQESYVMGLVAFLSFTRSRVDYFLLGKFLSFSQLAIYSMAIQVIGIMGKLNSIIVPIAGPLVHSIYIKKEPEKLNAMASGLLKLSMIAICMSSAVLFFFYQDILILYGKSFVLDKYIFSLLLIAQMIFIFFGVQEQFLLYTSHQKSLLGISVLTIALMALSFSIAVPSFGLHGAAWSVLIVYALYAAALTYTLNQKLGLGILSKSLLNLLMAFSLSSMIALAASRLFHLNKIFLCMVFLSSFSSFAWLAMQYRIIFNKSHS